MWGEGASDLWGRLEESEDERDDAELVAVIRARLSQTVQSPETERGSAEGFRKPSWEGIRCACASRTDGADVCFN
jgi:hypothetical protein